MRVDPATLRMSAMSTVASANAITTTSTPPTAPTPQFAAALVDVAAQVQTERLVFVRVTVSLGSSLNAAADAYEAQDAAVAAAFG